MVQLPISVVIPTIRGWPHMRMPLDPLRAQAIEHGAEVIVLDASGGATPSEADVGFPVRWLHRPGGNVFSMRREGFELASAGIVATTEDHCTVAPDWIASMLRAHATHPEAVAVGGAVENGTPGRTLWWAAFLRIQGPFMVPLANGPVGRLTGAANLSYKRPFLDRVLADMTEDAFIDFLDAMETRHGEVLLADDSIRVAHHQPTPFLLTSELDFHNGRSTAGRVRREMAARDWLRLAGLSLMPAWRTVKTIRTVGRKDVPARTVMGALPVIAWLHTCQAAGELVGYAAGPGDSPSHLY